MKRNFKALPVLLMLVIASSVFSAETSVKGTIYANWMMNLTEGKNNYNAFTIDRAYFGAESKLSDYTWMRITFDIRPDKFKTSETPVVDTDGDTVKIPKLTAYSGYGIILKYAYADWKVKPIAQVLKLRFGMQPTMYLNYMDGNWGRRYIEKNTGDLNEFTSTSDLGLSALFSLGPQGSLGEAGLSILNGTKYSDFEDKNNNKDLNFFGKLTPFYNNGDFNQIGFFGQVYLGTQNRAIATTETASDWKKQIISVGGKLAYQKKVDFCFDMNFHTLGLGAGKDDQKQTGLSFWGNVYMNALVPTSPMFKTLALYGRFDQYDPNTEKDDDGYSLIIAGVECAPIKGVKASIAYKQKTLQVANGVDEKYLMLNTEFKF
jgi:hypothetical protein